MSTVMGSTSERIDKLDCVNCPSYLPEGQVLGFFGREIGAAVCGRYGYALGRPDSDPVQDTRLRQNKATNCPSYGKQPPVQPPLDSFKIAFPDLAYIETADLLAMSIDKTNVTTCNSCLFYARDTLVEEHIGFTQPMCTAKGRLLLSNRLVMEARSCEMRVWGTSRTDLNGVTLLPEYADAFSYAVNPIQAYFAAKDDKTEPGNWPTDKELDDEDRTLGIKAYRKIDDPEGSGNFVFLPVYDDQSFTDEERTKVPRTGDDEHPELYVDHNGAVYKIAVLWTELDETPALWGVAGVGKTELYRHLAWLMCLPFERISITGSTELDDLAGKMHFTPERGTYFEYGRIPQAWKKPCVICLDEPNTGQPDVWQFLRPLTDNSKQLVVDQNNGERIDRHLSCFMGMAMNPAWDARNVGAETIGDADGSRLMHIFMEMPPEKLEREIIKNRVALDGWEISDDKLAMIMRIALELRKLSEDQTLPITWGVRPQIKVARAMRWFEPVTAYRMASGDMLEPESQEALLDVVRAHVPGKKKIGPRPGSTEPSF